MYSSFLLLSTNRLIISFTFFIVLASSSVFAQAPQSIETTMKSMLSAIQSNTVAEFVAPGDQAFQEGMTSEMLSSISQSLSSRLKQGYMVTFLTKMNQQGFEVYVWKLEFKDGHDDILQFMALKNGKVGGFWLR